MKFKRSSMPRFSTLKNKLWFDIFLKVGAVFVVFLAVLLIANSTLLSKFFSYKQRNLLLSRIQSFDNMDLSDSAEVSRKLTEISDSYNIDVEIYNSHGKVLYTTHGSQMMDFFIVGRDNFSMSHEDLVPSKREVLSDGTVFEVASKRFDSEEFMLCRKKIGDDTYAELRTRTNLLASSARTAGEFVSIIAVVCFLGSVIWIFIFARKFSKPLTSMSEITHDMAKLNFSRKLEVKSKDEIGLLAQSINEMSCSLDTALSELKDSNAKLRDEIELERQLDVMRRGFVANVSHELKTPISIISGYAEGLKLNVNSDSRDDYCNTIIDESARMNKLVLSILELSRYESGQIPINCNNFDISKVSRQMSERIFKDSDITAFCEVPENTMVYADEALIEQVLKAYLENAHSHTPGGGKVTVSAADSDEKIRISVTNTGSHIDDDIMPQIWQSFYRGDTSHKREQSRFGLGLSIVNAIMKMHNCDCGVYNTSDGVCFWFDALKEKGET